MTTGKPVDARALGGLVHEHKGSYLDGSIMGFPNHIGTSDNLILYSGDDTAFNSQQRRLEMLGQTRYLGENPGAAAALDLGALMPIMPMVVGLVQGMKAYTAEGVSNQQYDSFIREWVPLVLEDKHGKTVTRQTRRRRRSHDCRRRKFRKCLPNNAAKLTPTLVYFARWSTCSKAVWTRTSRTTIGCTRRSCA